MRPTVLLNLCAALMSALGAASASAQEKVAYARDVKPILDRACASCHSGGTIKGGFSMDAKDHFTVGGDSGPAVVVGKSGDSYLIQLVEGRVEGMVMPLKGPRLSGPEIDILRRWIDEGLDWDAEAAAKLSVNARPKAELAPRRPVVKVRSAAEASSNPVDLLLASYFEEHGLKELPPVSDAMFARRAFLDVVGLLPTVQQLRDFETDPRWEKRERLIDSLLADRRGYAEHWITFWNDMLRNDFAGTGYIDGGREQITGWLYESLSSNKPYDQFVRELVDPVPGSAGFIKGIVWRGVVNASQTVPLQASQNISQVFMGTNMKCASCHDSFINQWKLSDAYGLASIFSDEPLEMIRCDVPTGRMSEMHFLYPELGEIPTDKPKAGRIAELARIMTRPENGRLTRTIVNRVWAVFMGRGLVEPLDDMDQPAWDKDLLDWLATDFVDHGWDMKHLMRRILTSRAYQLPSVPMTELTESGFVFHGPVVRRMSAEQWLDSVSGLTGVWQPSEGARVNYSAGTEAWETIQSDARATAAKARWIWSAPGSATRSPAGKAWFLRGFKIEGLAQDPVTEARFFATCDNRFVIHLNGARIGEGKDFNRLESGDFRAGLVEGWNVIAVEAENTAEGPAGFIGAFRVRRGGQNLDFGTDGEWLVSTMRFEGWEKPGFIPFEWAAASDLGMDGPWKVGRNLAGGIAFDVASRPGRLRAWQARADVLMRGLGRPNREQVVTRRASAATTLQALELTNGATLAEGLKRGAANLGFIAEAGPDAFARALYLQGVGREPTTSELEVAANLLGSPVTGEGIEDFLWSLVMLPEFQLIY